MNGRYLEWEIFLFTPKSLNFCSFFFADFVVPFFIFLRKFSLAFIPWLGWQKILVSKSLWNNATQRTSNKTRSNFCISVDIAIYLLVTKKKGAKLVDTVEFYDDIFFGTKKYRFSFDWFCAASWAFTIHCESNRWIIIIAISRFIGNFPNELFQVLLVEYEQLNSCHHNQKCKIAQFDEELLGFISMQSNSLLTAE